MLTSCCACLKPIAPEILSACQRALDGAVEDLNFLVLGDQYSEAQAISLDYAIVEKADTIGCVPLNTAWSDVGSWSELWNFLDKDPSGNVVQGEGEAIFEGTSNSFAFSTGASVALVGVSDLVVVAMDDAVLVASKDHAEAIKTLVNDMKGNGHDLVLQHTRVYRPWGWYEGLNRGDRYQVKCIMVKPGGKLSLQSHHHRSEHWVVVRGTLEVVKGEETKLLTENQSTYIPIGEKHRLSNPGRFLPFSLRCNRVPISPKTILSGLKIFTAEAATSSAAQGPDVIFRARTSSLHLRMATADCLTHSSCRLSLFVGNFPDCFAS